MGPQKEEAAAPKDDGMGVLAVIAFVVLLAVIVSLSQGGAQGCPWVLAGIGFGCS